VSLKYGGPAFPVSMEGSYKPYERLPQDGMTLRDYFAGQALTGWISDPNVTDWDKPKAAQFCYEFADAMLAAREKGGGQ
jgi:hypothetical protein